MSLAALQRLDFIVGLIDQVSGPAGKMMKTMDTVTTNVQTGFNKIGYGAAGLVGVGFAIDRLTSKAIGFESTMADVNKVVGFERPEDLAAFGQDILEMTKTLPLTANGLGEIAAAGGRLGLEEKVLPEFVNLSAKMATAFDIQTDMAGDYAATLSNIYGIPVNALGELGDVVNHLTDNTAAEAAPLFDFLKRTGGVAQQFGFTENAVSALGAQMLSLGVPAEQASTSMNAMMIKLNNLQIAGPKVQGALSSMGLDVKSFANELANDPQNALNDFLYKINQMDGADASMTLSTIFGLDHAPKIAMLAKSYDKYQDTLGLVANKHEYLGSMEREFQVRSGTTANKLVLLGNSWDRLMIGFGSIVLPAVINGISILTSVLDPVSAKMAKWSQMFPNLARWVGNLAGLVVGVIAAISALSIVVGLKIILMSGWALGAAGVSASYGFLKKSILTTIPAIFKFTAALLANPITWVVVGIVALIAAVAAAVVYWDVWTGKLVEWTSKWWEFIGLFSLVDGVLAAWDKLPEWWSGFKNWLGTLDPFSFVGDSLDWIISKVNLIPGISLGNVPGAPKPVSGPASLQSDSGRSPAGGGLVQQISNANANNSRSIGDINVYNSGNAMDGQTFMNELAFAAG